MTAAQARRVWAAVVPAAGSARRMGFDKILARIDGVPVLTRTLLLLQGAGLDHIVVGVKDAEHVRSLALAPFGLDAVTLVAGGETRSDTVRRCLAHVPPGTTYVLVHDAARPYCSAHLIRQVMAVAEESGAACAALPIVDTVHRSRTDGCIAETLDRRNLWSAQTPQAFRLDLLAAAHAGVPGGTDDAGMVATLGSPVHVVAGEAPNIKLTVPADMPESTIPDVPFAVGLGHDIHRLVPGRRLILGGVEIPHPRGLLGHSDADVLTHAIADALLGAAGLGDIGQHFPPGDPAYAGADSLALLARCRDMVAAAGWRAVQADCLILAESPRIGPHASVIRDKLATVLGIDPRRLNIKAGTNEGLGSLGRGEGIAAQAVVVACRTAASSPG